jgi:hypothetical protein
MAALGFFDPRPQIRNFRMSNSVKDGRAPMSEESGEEPVSLVINARIEDLRAEEHRVREGGIPPRTEGACHAPQGFGLRFKLSSLEDGQLPVRILTGTEPHSGRGC